MKKLRLGLGLLAALTAVSALAGSHTSVDAGGGGGGGPGTLEVKENGSVVDATATTLDLLGADFDVTSSPAGEANVVIAAAIARDAEVAAGYQPLDSDLTSIAALTTTAFGRAFLALADAAAARTATGTVIGTNVQAWDAVLDDIAAATFAQGDVIYYNGTNLVRLAAGASGQFLKTNGAGANPAWATASGTGDVVGPASATDNAIARYDTTTGKLLQNSGVTVDDNGVVSVPSSGRIDIAANTTAGQYIEWCEDADLGTDCLRIDLAAVNLASDVTQTPDTGGKFNADSFLTAGTASGALATKHKTQKISIPVVADSSGAVTHVDLRAFFSVADAVTLVRVSCWTGQANGFSVDVVERAETTPTTGTTGSLTSALACDTDSQASTSFTDSAVDADDLVFLDITTESLAAGEFGGVTIEYTVN